MREAIGACLTGVTMAVAFYLVMSWAGLWFG